MELRGLFLFLVRTPTMNLKSFWEHHAHTAVTFHIFTSLESETRETVGARARAGGDVSVSHDRKR